MFFLQGVASLTAHHLYETFFAQRDGQPPVGDAKTPLQKIGDNVGNELSNRLAEVRRPLIPYLCTYRTLCILSTVASCCSHHVGDGQNM